VNCGSSTATLSMISVGRLALLAELVIFACAKETLPIKAAGSSTKQEQGRSRGAGRLTAHLNDPLLLAQTSVEARRSRSEAASTQGRREPLSAGWFDAFSQSESDYDVDADRGAQRSHGWEYKRDNPFADSEVKRAIWYHESKSGGNVEAWQTHFPALRRGIAARSATPGRWRMTDSGHWSEDYQLMSGKLSPSNPTWFDASVKQFDSFGRRKAPVLDSPRLFVATQQERAVNTTIACQSAGCEAHTVLQAFNGNQEHATHCKLSLFLHPTDFDDSYSGERLTFIKVNGVTVNTDCFPMVSGCNASLQRPMFPCLQDLPLDSIIDQSGTLNISAQISDTVDECPYQGNLLSGVPLVTCLVAPQPKEAPTPKPVGVKLGPLHGEPPEVSFFHVSAALRCPYRGCVATANLRIGSDPASRLSQCKLNVKIYQTDFDNEENTNETLEFVQVSGATVVERVSPGQNPCRAAWAGHALSPADAEHELLRDHDVTADASRGLVSVTAKITDHVDECAHDGYLLDGLVDMNCTLRPLSTLAEENVTDASATLIASTASASSLVQVNTSTSPVELMPPVMPRLNLREALRAKLRPK